METASNAGVYKVRVDGEEEAKRVVIYPSGKVKCDGPECEGECQHIRAAQG